MFIERTEERRKVFQIAKTKKAGSMGSAEFANTPFAKWRKLLSELPSSRNEDDPIKQFSHATEIGSDKDGIRSKKEKSRGSYLTDHYKCKIILKIKFSDGKIIISDDEETTLQDDGTDTDQHESLPEDKISIMESKTFNSTMHKSGNVSKTLQKKDANISGSASLLQETITQAKKDSSKSSKKKLSGLHQSSSKSISSSEKRRDSASVAPTEGIPVITISKTESSESILQDTKDQRSVDTASSSHKPKIKYMLKKQDANVDIDSISFI